MRSLVPAAVTAATAALGLLIGVSPAFAATVLAPGTFSVGTGVPGASYYSIHVLAGSNTPHDLVVSNPTGASETLAIRTELGLTATYSGDTYVPSHSGAAGWLAGLPSSVKLGPHAKVTIPFQVDVPSHTKAADYLAGVAAQSTPGSLPDGVKTTGKPAATATVVRQVVLGVAVYVGTPAISSLKIQSVTAAASYSELVIREHNAGLTFLHPIGTVSVGSRSWTLRSSTVLPGGTAYLVVHIPRLAPAPHVASVDLIYRHGTKHVSWSGVLVESGPQHSGPIPASTGPQLVHVFPSSPFPWIVVVAAGVASAGLGALAGVGIVRYRRGSGRTSSS
ncbi:MAG: hypothetical protein M1115_09580 [Actinobacteria bacterium]|nr:hypothetical protein [Actinomycetota bacterium]